MIKYREATLLDLPILVSLDREYFPDTAWPAEQFRAELSGKTRKFLIAEDGERIIGYASAYLPAAGGDCDLMTIAVSPEHRRKGIAKYFISELQNWAKDHGAASMMLEVDVKNEAAISLYSALGFEKLNIRKNYYGYGKDAQIMKSPI